MTKRTEPTQEEMSAAIEKRMVIVGGGVEALRGKQQKRKYNVGKVDSELTRLRQGTDPKVNVAAANATNGE